MQKAPDRDRGLPYFLRVEVVRKSGGGGAEFLACELLFGAEPVFHLVAVLAAACLIQFVRPRGCSSWIEN